MNEFEKTREFILKNPNHPHIQALNALLPERYRVKLGELKK